MENICIPINLDAFALSPDLCSGKSTIAPYSQPNYVSLRLDSHLIQHDIQDQVDFHLATNAKTNPRFADVGSDKGDNLKAHRMGVHLHWTLPRLYRTASSKAPGNTQSQTQPISKDEAQPTFRSIPNRWLVVRHLQSSDPPNVLPAFQSWVIESNAWRKITETADSVDLESEVAPFVSYDGDPNSEKALKNQAEVLIGNKYDLATWKEDSKRTYIKPFTVMTSSNPLFPDFALQNTNVLSMIDNFSYMKSGNTVAYCTKALANYYVLGWHGERQDDPLSLIRAQTTLGDALSELMLKLDLGTESQPDRDAQTHNTNTSQSDRSTRSISHGAIYDVRFNLNPKTEEKPISLADQAAAKFTTDFKMEPLSLGTTVLEGILTFLEAHKTDADQIFGTGATALANELLQISTLLYASGDEYDSRVQAQDLISHQKFRKTDGGSEWVYDSKTPSGQPPAVPSAAETLQLRKLNEAQRKFDYYSRKLRYVQWDLFSEWWKFVSNIAAATEQQKSRVSALKQTIQNLVTLRDATQNPTNSESIPSLSQLVACKKSSKAQFFQRSDPSICIAGLNSGFPDDFMDTLKVSEDHQKGTDTATATTKIFKDQDGKDLPLPIPKDNNLDITAKKILSGYINITADQKKNLTTGTKTTGSQAWGGQNPFVPLFIEWEGVYYHVDNDNHDAWAARIKFSSVGHPSPEVRYNPARILAEDKSKDIRVVSGRILILPQPTFNLEAIVMQVLDNASAASSLTEQQKIQQRNIIQQNIRKLRFISAPLAGLTSHLLTRREGSHVKPNVRVQGERVVPLSVAATASEGIGIDKNALVLIDSESALTPYGNLLEFAGNVKPPFKPVTQGQMIFTKLNIIDKFGQAVCLPLPKPRLRKPITEPMANLYPCLSDYLSPEIRSDGFPNTVYDQRGPSRQPGAPPMSQYFQLPPSINQEARINASFLVRDTTDKSRTPWRVATDYESPIWGWMIINYADSGIQFFQSDGTFYQEIRKGGALGTNASARYIPFRPSKAANPQLDGLIAQFSPSNDKAATYLQTFFDMINGAQRTIGFAPASYAGYASSLVGAPLVLANAGFSLELAQPALTAQNTLGPRLSPDDSQAAYQAQLGRYAFPLKLGDASRTFDGLVGYFDAGNPVGEGAGKGVAASPDLTDWSTLYTYFGLQKTPLSDPLSDPNCARIPAPTKVQPIAPSTFPALNPHYIDPVAPALGGSGGVAPDVTSAAASQFAVKTLILDPFSAVHAFSPVLPTVALRFQNWVLQDAFARMSAFVRLGPSLLSSDVPRGFPPPATTRAAGLAPDAPVEVAGAPKIKLPLSSGGKAKWNWLQPYDVEGEGQPRYASLQVEEDRGNSKWAEGPYTFVEGYLQLEGGSAKVK